MRRFLALPFLLAILGQSPVGAQSTTFVQCNSQTPQTPQSSVAVAYRAVQYAGDLDVVIVGWNDSSAQVQSVTDTVGNSYSLAAGPTVQSGVATQAIYYAKNISSAAANANTVTVTFTTAAIFPDIRIAEYSGVTTTNPLDGAATSQGNSDTSDSGILTTSTTNELLIGANLVQGSSLGPGTAYTERLITVDGDILEDQTVMAAGSYRATVPLDQVQPWIMQVVPFAWR